jgi:hypothetical protein
MAEGGSQTWMCWHRIEWPVVTYDQRMTRETWKKLCQSYTDIRPWKQCLHPNYILRCDWKELTRRIQEGHVTGCQQRGVHEAKVCCLRSSEGLFILWSSGSGHCVAGQVGVSLSYDTLKCWVFSYRTTWYPNPQDHNTVEYAVCKLSLGGTDPFICWWLMHFLWKVHFNSLPWT